MHNKHSTPKSPKSEIQGKRAEINPIDEAIPSEIEKALVSGVVTDCFSLNIRESPEPDAEVLAVILFLDEVRIDPSASTDEFYKVCTAAGVEGYCVKKYIASR